MVKTIIIHKCKDCPYFVSGNFLSSFCSRYKIIIRNRIIIHKSCKLSDLTFLKDFDNVFLDSKKPLINMAVRDLKGQSQLDFLLSIIDDIKHKISKIKKLNKNGK